MSVATEPTSAITICQYLLAEERENEEIYWSDIHKREIKSENFTQFLIQHASRQQTLQHPFVTQNLPAIQMIAIQGITIWDATLIPPPRNMCKDFLKNILCSGQTDIKLSVT